MYLNSEQCDVHWGTQGVAYLADVDLKNGRFIFWLNEQEASHDYVVYEADYEPTAWTRRCVRQADLVLIVGNANGSPALSNIEAGLLARAENQQIIQCMVLLHDEKSDLPQNTREYDIKKLLSSFNALIEQGHSIIIIEHNMDVIRSADWIIDLGPEAGNAGGNLVYTGSAAGFKKEKSSITAQFL